MVAPSELLEGTTGVAGIAYCSCWSRRSQSRKTLKVRASYLPVETRDFLKEDELIHVCSSKNTERGHNKTKVGPVLHKLGTDLNRASPEKRTRASCRRANPTYAAVVKNSG